MKKFFSLFFSLFLIFGFVTFVNAEEVDVYPESDFSDFEVDDSNVDVDLDFDGGEDLGDNSEEEFESIDENRDVDVNSNAGIKDDDILDNTIDNFDSFEDNEVVSNDELLNQDANVENSQTSDIPIIFIASLAILSLIFVLSKKRIFVNNGY